MDDDIDRNVEGLNVLVPSSYSPGGLKQNVYKYWETYVADKKVTQSPLFSSLCVTVGAFFYINRILFLARTLLCHSSFSLCCLNHKTTLKHLLVICFASPTEPFAVYNNVQAV